MFETAKRLRELKKKINYVRSPWIDSVTLELNGESEGVYSPFCPKERPIISSECAEYLDNMIEDVHIKSPVKLKIIGGDKERIKKAIDNYYGNRVEDTERALRRNAVLALIFTFVAAVVLTFKIIMNALGIAFILDELIDIVGWVFMWEAVDLFILQRGILKIEQIRCLSLIATEVE